MERSPVEFSVALTPLETLVHHRVQCQHDLPMEDVQRLFQETQADYIALVREERVSGMCSRTRVGSLLGSRFGFALNSRTPAHAAQVSHPLVFIQSTPVRKILDRALGRPAEEFHEDVILIDEDARLIGLVPTQTIARLQTRLVNEQLKALQTQHETERRQNLELFHANQALRETQGIYRGLFDSSAIGVALLDVEGGVQTHNRRLAEILGVERDNAKSVSLADLVTQAERPEFRSWLAGLEHTPAAGAAKEFHFDLGPKGTRMLRLSIGYIQETSQISACVDDVTSQRALEQHMQRQEKQELLDTLAGGIAHELNNKITPILGFAQLLEDQVDERLRRYTDHISKSVEEAAKIIRQLLQLSKPQLGTPEAIDLAKAVSEVLAMLKFQLHEANTTVQVSAPPEPVAVFADFAQIKQVVMNLLINALHAMGETPQPRLAIVIAAEGSKGRLDVVDNGTGIPESIIGRIFDPFFTTKAPNKGTGLGLSVCISLVRQQGGTIAVTSEAGRGTRFVVRLPLAAAAVLDPLQAPLRKVDRFESNPPGSIDVRVLVVEDEPLVRHFVQEALRTGFGCRVDAAMDGAEGLRKALETDYSIVISDVRMPGLNGPEFYRRLTTLRPATKDCFVFTTGHAGETSLGRLLEGASIPVLSKPFTMKQLLDVCRPMIERVSRV